jgi:peroxiredoxin Q/BCP
VLNAGDLAPDFELADDNGNRRKLSELLAQGPVVLFFYPKAMTSGCTRESCHFRDLASEFAALGARRVGISADSVDRQKQFSDKHAFDFPLLSDPDRAVARAFGAKRPGPLFNKRITFVIDTDRRVLAVIKSETHMDQHADEALAVLSKRTAA